MENKWYVIKTQNNKEKSVSEKLKHELIQINSEKLVNRYLIPMTKVHSVRNGKRITRDKILYPGYIFIETNAVGELNNIIKLISGASGFVRTRSGDINPLKDEEVASMLKEESEEVIQSDYFSIGESVKIIEGPFSTFKGVINDIIKEKNRAKVEVLVFGRPTVVELEFTQIDRST